MHESISYVSHIYRYVDNAHIGVDATRVHVDIAHIDRCWCVARVGVDIDVARIGFDIAHIGVDVALVGAAKEKNGGAWQYVAHSPCAAMPIVPVLALPSGRTGRMATRRIYIA